MSRSILITTSSFDVEASQSLSQLRAQGWEFVLNPMKRKLTADEVTELLKTHQPLGMIAGVEPLGGPQLSANRALKVLSRCGTGMENVDLLAARELGIAVFNTPDAPSPSVAELALGLILACLRQIPQADRAIREGRWGAIKGSLLSGKTVGIIGFGRIGKKLAQLLSGFGVSLKVCDPMVTQDDLSGGALRVELDTLLSESDIVSLHLPGGTETHHLISANRLSKMKKGAVIINIARGGLIDETALLAALQSGHIFAAGLDVFEHEPYDGPLARHPNVVLTSHMGSSAQETRRIMEEEAAANLLKGLITAGLATA